MSLRELVSKKTNAIYDPKYTEALQNVPWYDWFQNTDRPLGCQAEYLETIDGWIHSTKNNDVDGLRNNGFKSYLINGTTQAFDDAYRKYTNRRLRVFKGEYAYHLRINPNFKFLDDEPELEANDWIIISYPHCTLGKEHPMMKQVLDTAHKKNIPVLIDSAYFGTCYNIEFDYSHPAITQVCFSLSKGLGLGDIRSGVLYSKLDELTPITQQNDYTHNVLLAAKVGIYMMEQFTPDQVPNRFRDFQEETCDRLGVTPTNCVHLALGGPEWDDFKIDGVYNRLGIREAVKQVRRESF